MVRLLALSSCLWLPLWGQAPLRIRVVEGEGFIYPVGSRATRGVVVEVTDAEGRPVEGATVRFELPRSGPTGEFPSGGRIASMITRADGRAEVWGMQWNREAGPVELRVTASKGTRSGEARIGLALTRAAVPVNTTRGSSPGRKKLWITLAVAGAAGVAVAQLAGRSPSQTGAASGNPPRIGTPTITIGRP